MIQPYSYKPPTKIHRALDELFAADEHTYGTETEVDDINNSGKSRESVEADYSSTFVNTDQGVPFTYQKQDGSLHNGGFEVVSHAATLAYHKSGAVWDARLRLLDTLGARSHNTETCGLHIHVGRNAMAWKHQIRVAVFINRFPKLIAKLARRACHYNEFHNNGNRNYARFTEIPDWPQGTEETIETAMRFRQLLDNDSGSNSARYRAVNFQNSKTLEFRFFKGTLKATTHIASIEFCDAVIRFTKTRRISFLTDANKEMVWSLFCGFVAQHDYPDLIAYMQKKEVYTPADDLTNGNGMAIENDDAHDDNYVPPVTARPFEFNPFVRSGRSAGRSRSRWNPRNVPPRPRPAPVVNSGGPNANTSNLPADIERGVQAVLAGQTFRGGTAIAWRMVNAGASDNEILAAMRQARPTASQNNSETTIRWARRVRQEVARRRA